MISQYTPSIGGYNNNFNNQDTFENALFNAGFPQINCVQNGQIHRFGKDDKLWYICFGHFGVAGDWSEQLSRTIWQNNAIFNALNNDEKAAKIQIQNAINEAEKLRVETQKVAAKTAVKIYDNAQNLGNSAYLLRKKIDIKTDIKFGKNNEIIVPICDINFALSSLQFITENGEKRFLKDGKIKGCFYAFGDFKNAKELYICEGFATGASIFLATKTPTICAFFAGNLLAVLQEFKAHNPHKTFTICGDNDAFKDVNIGKIKAEEAGRKFGYKVALPKFKNLENPKNKPTDFNDLFCLEGENEVRKQLHKTRFTKCNILDIVTDDIPQKQSILAPIINEGSLTMLFAQRGVGKTFVSLEIAFCVASGQGMFSDIWQTNEARKVLFIDGEMPLCTIQKRLRNLIKRSKVENFDAENFQIIASDSQEFGTPDLSTRDGQQGVEELLDDDIALIVIDNLSTLCRTGRENESESWLPVQEWILNLRHKNIAVLLVHHAGKNDQQRGNSKKEDVLDTVIQLKRPSDYDSSEGARFIVIYTKNRNFTGDEAKSFEAKLVNENWEIKDANFVDDALLNDVIELHNQKIPYRKIAQNLGLGKEGESKVYRIIKQHQQQVKNI